MAAGLNDTVGGPLAAAVPSEVVAGAVDAVGAFRIERPSQRGVEEYPGLDLWWVEGLEVGW